MRFPKFCFWIGLIISILSLHGLHAQDPVFTQFYAAPTIMNPAFVGSTGNTRLGVGYRDQWIKNASKLSTFYAVADGYVESINSGIGFNLVNQREELTNYSYTQLNLMYSFQLRLSRNPHTQMTDNPVTFFIMVCPY